jgi:chemotaxis protein CheC
MTLGKDSNEVRTYSDLQLDALRELANIGSGSAATALSKLLRRPIDVSVPSAQALPLADALDSVGSPDSEVTAVVLPIFGDMEAIVVLLFQPDDAAAICGFLGVDSESEWGLSALCEIGNILGCSYVGALGSMSGLAMEPRPPEAASDVLAAVVSSVLAVHAESTQLALLLDSDLIVEGTECSFSFMLVPTAAGVDDLLARLGVDG